MFSVLVLLTDNRHLRALRGCIKYDPDIMRMSVAPVVIPSQKRPQKQSIDDSEAPASNTLHHVRVFLEHITQMSALVVQSDRQTLNPKP